MNPYLAIACQESFSNFTTELISSSDNKYKGYTRFCNSGTIHQFNETCSGLGPTTFNFTAGVLLLDSFCRNQAISVGGALWNETQANRCTQGFLTLAQTVSVTNTSTLCPALKVSLNDFHASCMPLLDFTTGGSVLNDVCEPEQYTARTDAGRIPDAAAFSRNTWRIPDECGCVRNPGGVSERQPAGKYGTQAPENSHRFPDALPSDCVRGVLQIAYAGVYAGGLTSEPKFPQL
ncbi:hypothetical protein BDR26DRAFT_1004584 [Obelidium mucronatum]|nr:hypothetical protein BDR26DRAFT_1004584 [Obelidium mucronatum]